MYIKVNWMNIIQHKTLRKDKTADESLCVCVCVCVRLQTHPFAVLIIRAVLDAEQHPFDLLT